MGKVLSKITRRSNKRSATVNFLGFFHLATHFFAGGTVNFVQHLRLATVI